MADSLRGKALIRYALPTPPPRPLSSSHVNATRNEQARRDKALFVKPLEQLAQALLRADVKALDIQALEHVAA